MVRTAPQGLEVFRPMANPEEPNKAVMTIDYYSVEVMNYSKQEPQKIVIYWFIIGKSSS